MCGERRWCQHHEGDTRQLSGRSGAPSPAGAAGEVELLLEVGVNLESVQRCFDLYLCIEGGASQFHLLVFAFF